jgi:hypothetical protein
MLENIDLSRKINKVEYKQVMDEMELPAKSTKWNLNKLWMKWS